ncbi:MAG: hypothetical protein PUB46_12125 [Lachnospiraceae bacterium]|uniref:hypothetical protein n=1 Tax=Roseburia hominis TaxID=301301 RepID=UPI001F2FBFA2|nr:hypothetical protein [Roseburia hominis]MCI5712999.1 hypothetical protein [Lachnospiraceae bacterium]MDD6170794.1 hypothetical protein [Lachnospiraceae bacterium]MDY4838540.1 hypothetical protein [Lachnospiraceae bacterium]
MRDEAWSTFFETGKVEDYLVYRHEEEKNTTGKEVRGESGYGADRGAYGNDFTDNAHG